MHTTYYWGLRLYPHIRIPTTFFKPWQLEIFLVLDITQLSPLLVSKLLKRTRRCSNTKLVGLWGLEHTSHLTHAVIVARPLFTGVNLNLR